MLTDVRAALKQILIDTGDYAEGDVHTGRYTRITSLPAAAIIETELETVPITTGRPRTVEYTATATIETYAAETTDTSIETVLDNLAEHFRAGLESDVTIGIDEIQEANITRLSRELDPEGEYLTGAETITVEIFWTAKEAT